MIKQRLNTQICLKNLKSESFFSLKENLAAPDQTTRQNSSSKRKFKKQVGSQGAKEYLVRMLKLDLVSVF